MAVTLAMAESLGLTENDNVVLSQIFNPESAPCPTILVDPTLPADPHVRDVHLLASIRTKEGSYINLVEAVLKEPKGSPRREEVLQQAYCGLTNLIDAYPSYASARNNRAQLIRLQYGETVLPSEDASNPSQAAMPTVTAFSDLSIAISLLSPSTLNGAVSPSQCRTLAQAYTQRGALYYAASKTYNTHRNAFVNVPHLQVSNEGYNALTRQDFEEAASKDFFMGGRYGNGVGKVLAVHTNPTAKLCGKLVQEAMKREYGTSDSHASQGY